MLLVYVSKPQTSRTIFEIIHLNKECEYSRIQECEYFNIIIHT